MSQYTTKGKPLTWWITGLLVGCLTSSGAAAQQPPTISQAASNSNGQIADEISRAAENTPLSLVYVRRLADEGATQAIPMLESKFARTTAELTEAKILTATVSVEDLDKANIASALVRLGDTKQQYFDFLSDQASLAIKSNIPEYLTYDAAGKAGPGPSPQLSEWARERNLAPAALEEEVLMALPSAVSLLGITGDARAVPLLQAGLLNPNYQIQIASARGLAKVGDHPSIQQIIGACRRAPSEAASSIAAASLVYFSDGDAQQAASDLIPQERLKRARDSGHVPGADPFK